MTENDTEKRPTRRRKEARPAEIVAAGIAEFAEHGFERARLDRIAKAAGIAKGTIYLYFESKEALFMAAVEEYVLSSMTETATFAGKFEGTTRELFETILPGIYERMLSPENQAILRILISEGPRIPAVTETYHRVAIAKGVATIRAILERGVRRGEVREGAVITYPQLIMAPTMFLTMNDMIFADAAPIERETYVRGHIDMLLNGICA